MEDFEEFLGLPAIKTEKRHFSYELFGSFETSDIIKFLGLEGMFFTAAQNTGAGVVLYVFGFNPEDLPWENFQTKNEVMRLMKLKNIISTLKSMEDTKANEELSEIAAHTKVIARFDASAADLAKMKGKFISKTQYQSLIAKLGYLKANPR